MVREGTEEEGGVGRHEQGVTGVNSNNLLCSNKATITA